MGGDDGDDRPAVAREPAAHPRQTFEGAGRPMTREEAERILAGAERREQQIQRQQLKKDQTRIHGIRDW